MSAHKQKTEELVDAYAYCVWHVVKAPLLVKLGVCHSWFFPQRYTPVATVWAFSLEEAFKLTCTASGWDSPQVDANVWISARRNTAVGDVLVGRRGTYVVTPTGFQEFAFDWE